MTDGSYNLNTLSCSVLPKLLSSESKLLMTFSLSLTTMYSSTLPSKSYVHLQAVCDIMEFTKLKLKTFHHKLLTIGNSYLTWHSAKNHLNSYSRRVLLFLFWKVSHLMSYWISSDVPLRKLVSEVTTQDKSRHSRVKP